MSKKNGRNLESVDYTSVEEFLDQYIDLSEGIPPTITKVIRAVRARFQIDNKYTKQSIIDAVHNYYESKGWNECAIRSLKIALSNCSRDNGGRTRHTKPGWQMPEHQKKAVSKALKGCHFITDPITGRRRYVAP